MEQQVKALLRIPTSEIVVLVQVLVLASSPLNLPPLGRWKITDQVLGSLPPK